MGLTLIPVGKRIEYTNWLISGHMGSKRMVLICFNHMDEDWSTVHGQHLKENGTMLPKRMDALRDQETEHKSKT